MASSREQSEAAEVPGMPGETPVLQWMQGVLIEDLDPGDDSRQRALSKEAFDFLATDVILEQVDGPLNTSGRHSPGDASKLADERCTSALSDVRSVHRPDSRLPSMRRCMPRKGVQSSRRWPLTARDSAKMPEVFSRLEKRLDQMGRGMSHAAATSIVEKAQAAGHLEASPEFELAKTWTSHCWHREPRLRSRHYDTQGEREYQNYANKLHAQAATLLAEFDKDGDGMLNLNEARELFRKTAGCESKERQNPGAFHREAFGQLCDEKRGLSQADLVQLLDAGGGALGKTSRGHGSSLGEAGPWSPGEAVTQRLDGGADGQKSHRQRFRETQREDSSPPTVSALHDNITAAQASRAVCHGDASALAALMRSNALWASSNPFVLDEELKSVLGTKRVRFPLLFAAAHAGGDEVWNLLTEEASLRGELRAALEEDVEGWHLPAIICLEPGTAGKRSSKDSAAILRRYFQLCEEAKAFPRSLLECCLLQQDSGDWQGLSVTRPLHLLLSRGAEVWKVLIAILVQQAGFPHDEDPARMALVGCLLADAGSMDDFFEACREGGDPPKPGTQSFAGLYLGTLKNSVPSARSLAALGTLLSAGLDPRAALTAAKEQWPLHAAARHNRADVVKALLVASADPFTRNKRGLSAIDVARASRSWAAVSALQRSVGREVTTR